MLLFVVLGTGCETDLKEVDRLASIEAEEPVDVSLGVTIVFSDSTLVKAKIEAPEMRHYASLENPYYEFPESITIYFYDEAGEETQRITSDYAVRYELEERVEFRDNVVITRADGIQIRTEELIHDEKENTFFNYAPITGYSANGRSMFQGSSFISDGAFKNIEVQNTTGVMELEDNQLP